MSALLRQFLREDGKGFIYLKVHFSRNLHKLCLKFNGMNSGVSSPVWPFLL